MKTAPKTGTPYRTTIRWQRRATRFFRLQQGEPEIPPAVPPEMPPSEVPPGLPPQGPPEGVPEPPPEMPPGAPPEIPQEGPYSRAAVPSDREGVGRGGMWTSG